MSYMVPQLSIVFMAIVALAGVVIPIGLFFILKEKFHADILSFFVGCAVFIVFALLIEGTINKFLFSSSIGTTIRSSVWLYGIVGGMMAGIFEETGRYVAFKTVLKKKRDNDSNALMYGAGHGGFEAFYILVASMVSYIVMAVTLNNGGIDKLTGGITDPVALQRLYATFAALASTAPGTYLMAIAERIAAVVIQISLSVVVWFAVKEKGCLWFFPLAIVLHALVDAFAVILSSYIPNVWVIEGGVYMIAASYAVVARMLWKKYALNKEPDQGVRINTNE